YFFFLRKFHYIAMDREAQLKLTDQGERVVDGDSLDKFSAEVGEFFADQILGADEATQAGDELGALLPPPPPEPEEAETGARAMAPPPIPLPGTRASRTMPTVDPVIPPMPAVAPVSVAAPAASLPSITSPLPSSM